MKGEQHQAAVGAAAPDSKLGQAGQKLTPNMARSLGLPSAQGVVVTDVEAGSPADEVGIQQGDVILEVNQQQVTNLPDYRAALGRVGKAEPVLLLIRRGDRKLFLPLQPEKEHGRRPAERGLRCKHSSS
jgi:S1-C subfamily serine protease